ncbi:MAG: hypothetical protein RL557_1030 [archaeon]|jgi:replication factor A1
MDNYLQLVQLIAENSGISRDEIERRIEAKQAKLSGLISREGAAQVIAAELNINFDKQLLKIAHIVPGMRKINLVGKIITLFPIREYNKNGRSGRIGSFILADETSNIRTVLWDEHHIDLISKGDIVADFVVEITNASLKNGELHLGSFSELKISDKDITTTVSEKPTVKKSIYHFMPYDNVSTRAFIVQMFEPKFFEVCPQCRKKVGETKECMEHGKVVAERRALVSIVIDDGTESIRGTLFHDVLERLMPRETLENAELFTAQKKEFLGKEVFISGSVRRNALFNSNDFIVSDIKDVDLDRLIEELEA